MRRGTQPAKTSTRLPELWHQHPTGFSTTPTRHEHTVKNAIFLTWYSCNMRPWGSKNFGHESAVMVSPSCTPAGSCCGVLDFTGVVSSTAPLECRDGDGHAGIGGGALCGCPKLEDMALTALTTNLRECFVSRPFRKFHDISCVQAAYSTIGDLIAASNDR